MVVWGYTDTQRTSAPHYTSVKAALVSSMMSHLLFCYFYPFSSLFLSYPPPPPPPPPIPTTSGDCIGEPFHSPKRFPVVPPFGLAELAGPILTHQWSQLSSEQRSHLNGAHPSPSGGQRSSMVPRAVLKLANPRKEDGTMVLSYSPRQASIGHISVPGVKVLVRNAQRGNDITSCSLLPSNYIGTLFIIQAMAVCDLRGKNVGRRGLLQWYLEAATSASQHIT